MLKKRHSCGFGAATGRTNGTLTTVGDLLIINVIEGHQTMGRHAYTTGSGTGLDGLDLTALAGDRLAGWAGVDSFAFSVGQEVTIAAIRGTRGNDVLQGGSGDDVFYGGDGDDKLSGGLGQDRFYGGEGRDTAFGNEGDDLLFGGNGNDTLVGDAFVDGQSEPAGGNDTIYAGGGDDQVLGVVGDDLLFGGVGNDFFIGGVGNDIIYGGANDDRTLVSNGDDDLFGGTGNDTLTDGLGADDFTGGAGSDSFVYLIADDVDRDQGGPTSSYGVGDDRIFDFSLADRDKLVINLDLGYQVVVSGVVDDGTSTAFVLSYGEVITLTGFSGEDFEGGLRFDSVDDVNALSQTLYGYDAVALFGFG